MAHPTRANAPVARRGPDVIDDAQFRRRVRGWCQACLALSGPSIALVEPDGVEFAAALIGAWYAGKTVYVPGDVQPDTCRALAQVGVHFAGAFPDPWSTIGAVHDGDASLPFDVLDANTAALVIYTSGSTGVPQALHKRAGQLLAEVGTLEQQFGARVEGSEILATVSHQHIYGLLFKILWPLVTGRTFESVSVPFPEHVVAHLRERRTTVISGPAHLKRLPQSLEWAAARGGLAALFSSGGPISLDTVTSVESLLQQAPIEVYGSSETGGIAWRQRTGGHDEPWTPFPGVQVRDDQGHLSVCSPHLADASWFTVADTVTFDAEHRFTLCGRADRIVKIEGKRVSLVAIEQALLRSGLVDDARVVLLDTGRDELGAAVVPSHAGWLVLREDGINSLRARLTTAVSQGTERMARPRRWRVLDALPVNAVGKTTIADIERLFAPFTMSEPALHARELTPEKAHYDVYVSPHLQVFDGHFDKLPVLPGVAQVDWAITFGRRCFGIGGAFERLEAVKFHRLYQPGALLSLEMEWRAERALLTFKFTSSAGSHSSGRVFFAR
ncbi:MAG: AMP-binding protein [Gemmatimonadaceae bacterium]|nr:AMP-binding protein [Gemmatimonadaceae bacterium]MCC6432439.1 AMP-binding protein [Gemmatimonadaceae bacterium]